MVVRLEFTKRLRNLRKDAEENSNRLFHNTSKSTDKLTIAKWAELATSQTNPWMNAIRLHDSGHYEDAWPHYLLDAMSCSATGQYSRVALSLTLAAHCLEVAGHTEMAGKASELAVGCLKGHGLISSADKTIWLSSEVEDLLKSRTMTDSDVYSQSKQSVQVSTNR